MRDAVVVAVDDEIDALAQHVIRRHERGAKAAACRRAKMFGSLGEPVDAARWWRVAGRIGEIDGGARVLAFAPRSARHDG